MKRKVLRHVRAGSTYELTWNHILGFISNRYGGGDENIVDMPWVQIITWNDYPEGTQIEPRSGLNGTATYEQTLLYISRWKGDEVNEGEQETEETLKRKAIFIVNVSVDILNARRTLLTALSVGVSTEESIAKKENTLTVEEVDGAIRCLLLGDVTAAKQTLSRTLLNKKAVGKQTKKEFSELAATPSSESESENESREGGSAVNDLVKEDDKLSGAKRESENYIVVAALAVATMLSW